jgi:ankyrin repeat protein
MSALRKALKSIQKASQTSQHSSGALYDAYDKAMDRIQCQRGDLPRDAILILSWIVFAKRPIMAIELQHALAIEIGTNTLDEENIPTIDHIVKACAPLVTVDKESKIIRLVHYTTQEYFERTKKWFQDTEAEIATTCVTYLSFSVFESGFCQTDDELEQRLGTNPLYDYAAHNWGHHARAASASCQGILEFLRKQVQVEASIQALMAFRHWSGYIDSQGIPKQMSGLHLAAYFGVRNAVQELLGSPDPKDSHNRTPLSYAAENGHEAIVQLLLDTSTEADSRDKDGQTPLSYAAENGHKTIVQLLLDRRAEADSRDEYGLTPLSYAARNGYEAIVQLLLDTNAQADSRSKDGRTPLSYAAESGHEVIVQLLLNISAEPNARNKEGWTPLLWAASQGHKAIAQLLLERGADADVRDEDKQTPLSWAAIFGHEDIVQLLLEKGVEANERSEDGRTPLSYAAEEGYEAVVQLLLNTGIEIDTKDEWGQTPLFWAASNGHKTVVQLLLEKGAEADIRDEDDQTPLWKAAESGYEAVVQLLLDTGKVDIDSKDLRGWTPLLWAAERGIEAIVKLLLDNGADFSIENESGLTALQLAALHDHTDIEQLLVVRGAVEPKDFYGLQDLFF